MEQKKDTEVIIITCADKNQEEAQRAIRLLERLMGQLKMRFEALTLPLNVFALTPVENEIEPLFTDGLRLYFNARLVLEQYRERGQAALMRELAHITVHGVLGHFEIWEQYTHKRLLSAVMDIQAERLLRFLGLGNRNNPYDETELEQYGFGSYFRAQKDKKVFQAIKRLKKWTESDPNEVWMTKYRELKVVGNGAGDAQEGEGAGEEEDGEGVGKVWEEIRKNLFGKDIKNDACGGDISDLYSLAAGMGAEERRREVSVGMRSVNDYRSLLEKITQVNELSKERDNIDYALYQYGLSLYGDVPLIEPTESVEEKRLDHLVIAIDTSGSCDGALVESFVRDTARLLEELKERVVFESITLLQCDSSLQREDRCDSVYELGCLIGDRYELSGFGGTDFRPVFRKANQMEKNGEKVTALLYFTDGCGEYPHQKPAYPTYFIMPSDTAVMEEMGEEVPDWIEIVKIEIEEEKQYV